MNKDGGNWDNFLLESGFQEKEKRKIFKEKGNKLESSYKQIEDASQQTKNFSEQTKQVAHEGKDLTEEPNVQMVISIGFSYRGNIG